MIVSQLLPDDPRGARLMSVGRDLDAVRTSRARAEQVVRRLGGPPPGLIEDAVSGRCYWLLPCRSTSHWRAEHLGADAEVLGGQWLITVPGQRSRGRRLWWGSPGLADPERLLQALLATASPAATVPQPSGAAA